MGTSVKRLQQLGTLAPAPQSGTRMLFYTGWYPYIVTLWVLQPFPPCSFTGVSTAGHGFSGPFRTLTNVLACPAVMQKAGYTSEQTLYVSDGDAPSGHVQQWCNQRIRGAWTNGVQGVVWNPGPASSREAWSRWLVAADD
ncbi:hypothetical protein CCMA1212_000401 [Trichoderma ghanense]|uniref:Uncharacterized protein n=1 Tax=Trichoderma ghanense TaxID=65468 RepID=A0ABY2HKG9_9HYPO